jgi:hypothetical protein
VDSSGSGLPCKSLDGPFEVNAARAFHQNNVAGLEILLEPASGGLSVG